MLLKNVRVNFGFPFTRKGSEKPVQSQVSKVYTVSSFGGFSTDIVGHTLSSCDAPVACISLFEPDKRMRYEEVMALHEALFRNSVWSHDRSEVILHGLADRDRPGNNVDNGNMPRVSVPVSKFSLDSDDDKNGHSRIPSSSNSPNSSQSQPRIEECARGQKPSPLLHRLRTPTLAQQPQRYAGSWPRSSRGEEKKPRRRPRPNIAALEDEVVPDEPNMRLLRKTLLVATICMAHLCARELVPRHFHSKERESGQGLIRLQRQELARHYR